MRVVYQIEGQRETIRNIGMYDMKKKKEAASIVRKHANAVRKEAKKRVPVTPADRKKSAGSPGDLKKSIRAKYYFEGLGAMVMPAKPKGSHRHLVEYGTKDRYQKKTGRYVGRNPAQPFMAPAKNSQVSSYNSQMRKLFEGDETIV